MTDSGRPPLRIAFIGLKCYDLLVGAETPRYLGGIERQFVALARAVKAAGHEVSFLTYDHGDSEAQSRDGVRIIPAFGPDQGLPILRFLFPRMFGIRRALSGIPFDYIFQMGAGTETLASALACGEGPGPRRFVFFAASDSDCRKDLPLIRHAREKVAYRQGLSRADAVFVQSDAQAKLMAQSYGVASTPLVMPAGRTDSVPDLERSVDRVLWLGRVSRENRPHLLAELAKLRPNVEFDVVGDANVQGDYAEEQKAALSEIPNVTVHGKVSESQLKALFETAAVVCNTSEIEGFPTTFLEAWSLGIPVVSTFDPDNLIGKNGLGVAAANVHELANGLDQMTAGTPSFAQSRHRCLEFFASNYSGSAIVSKLFRTLADSS